MLLISQFFLLSFPINPIKSGFSKSYILATTPTDVTVKDAVATLDTVKQTASNAFAANFTADASKTITKDDIKVVAADGSSELAVKSVEYSADGKSAVVTLFGNFINNTVYKVSCKDATVELAAKVGAVARITIGTASAEQNIETPIEFTLVDADGIDVTPSVSLDTTCFVTVTGDYSAANVDKASKASLTMNTVNAKADVTVTYNSNVVGATDVTATQTVTCVDTKATQGTKLFVDSNNTNTNSTCAKFYLGLSSSEVSVAVGGNTPNVYFCAKDSKGDVISYDSYEVESSNDDVASAALTVTSGKYAKMTVTGNTIGATQLNVKATKNGKDTYYTIPVKVTTKAEAASMTVSIDRPTMSDVADPDYVGTITAKLFDKDGKEVGGNFTYTLKTDATTPISISQDGSGKATVTAAGADEKTYTIEVVGADNNNNTKTFTKRITVTVKKLPTVRTALNLVYQIELSRTAIDENPADTSDDKVTAKLYATYNGLFAGYVRADNAGSTSVEIAEGSVGASSTTGISNVKVCAKFGTKTFNTTNGFVTTGAAIALNDAVGATAGETFTAVANNTLTFDVATKTSSDLAKTGLYTIEYSYTQNGKATSKTRTVTVSNTVFIPSVTVTTRTVDSLNSSDFIAALKTNVDMNNNTSDYVSINNPVTASVSSTKELVKSVEVVDNYSAGTWTFVVPVNATFKTE